MKRIFRSAVKYLPLVLGLGILAIAIPLVPWHQVLPYLGQLSLLSYGALIVFSVIYYLGRIIRYWLMLRLLGHPTSFEKVALACLIAQPVSVLPAGELYRAAMLRRYANVSMTHGAPSVFAQSITESAGLLMIAFIGAAVIHRYVVLVIIIALLFGAVWAYIRWQNDTKSHRLINHIPGVTIHHSKLRSYLDKNRTLLGGVNFFLLLGTSLISTGAGIGIIFVITHGLGAHLSLFQVAIAYALPVVLEAISFLPGGLGINENSSVAILTLFGLGLPLAIATTLIMRLFTLGIGFIYGFGAMIWARLGNYRVYHHER